MSNIQPNTFKSTTKSGKYLRYISFFGIGVMVIWLLLVLSMDSNVGTSGDSEETRSNLGVYITFIGLVSALVYVYWLSLKKTSLISDEVSSENLKIIERLDIDENSRIIVMEVNNEIWVLSASQSNLSMLGKFQKNDWLSKDKTVSFEE
jgi:flagellar biogenesis protein FliO